MLYIFNSAGHEGVYGAILWGKVRPNFDDKGGPPVELKLCDNGSERYSFSVQAFSQKLKGQNNWETDNVKVMVWWRKEDPVAQNAADVVKLLRVGDPVVVMGKCEFDDYVNRDGETKTSYVVYADMIIPNYWMNNVFLAMYSKIIANAELPKRRRIKEAKAPKVSKKGGLPQIAHVNTINENEVGGFFE